MANFGKGPFGGGVNISAEIVNGVCPACEQPTVLVSLYETLYKCTSCGHQLEQKVNGVIRYIPASAAGGRIPTLETTQDGT
jgi:predicted RNA-binding Zn-ribbon protein involved in translation (DUF1610 family)